jgi:hypothetical protein
VEVIRPPAEAAGPVPPNVRVAPDGLPPGIVEAAPDVVTTPVTPPDASLPPEAPPGASPADAAEESLPTPAGSNVIALILPLDVPAYERAAGAVRDGFLDAAEAAGMRGNCVVLAHGADGVVSAFDATTHAYVKGVFTNGLGLYSLSLAAGTYHLRFTGTTPSSLSQYYDHKVTIDTATPVTLPAGASVTASSDLAP